MPLHSLSAGADSAAYSVHGGHQRGTCSSPLTPNTVRLTAMTTVNNQFLDFIHFLLRVKLYHLQGRSEIDWDIEATLFGLSLSVKVQDGLWSQWRLVCHHQEQLWPFRGGGAIPEPRLTDQQELFTVHLPSSWHYEVCIKRDYSRMKITGSIQRARDLFSCRRAGEPRGSQVLKHCCVSREPETYHLSPQLVCAGGPPVLHEGVQVVSWVLSPGPGRDCGTGEGAVWPVPPGGHSHHHHREEEEGATKDPVLTPDQQERNERHHQEETLGASQKVQHL